jgi:hypothetical protein
MVTRSPLAWWWVALLVVVAGCGSKPTLATDSGAKDVVQAYCDAIVRRDWVRAYGTLHPESRARWSESQFARAAEAYRAGLGFDSRSVRVRSCEEQGDRAVAHVTFTRDGRRQQYRDGMTLAFVEGTWRVMLPPNFGKKLTR